MKVNENLRKVIFKPIENQIKVNYPAETALTLYTHHILIIKKIS